jgi:site-specific DNA-cytosine methylase
VGLDPTRPEKQTLARASMVLVDQQESGPWEWDILKVRSYGDPTNRARLFIVETRRDITADTNLKDIRFDFPEPQF